MTGDVLNQTQSTVHDLQSYLKYVSCMFIAHPLTHTHTRARACVSVILKIYSYIREFYNFLLFHYTRATVDISVTHLVLHIGGLEPGKVMCHKFGKAGIG